MKNRRLGYTAVLLLLIMITTSIHAFADERPLNIMIASDLHYISPAINDNGEMFRKITEAADGKVSLYCGELLSAFLTEAVRAKPGALILSGDLSFNGARQSHEDIAELLRRVEAAGIPVLVTTGNHDVNYPQAAAFSGNSYTRLPMTTSEAFRDIYAEFGYDEAIDRDAASLSYVYQLRSGVRILVLDLNVKGHSCEVQASTLQWIENALKSARDAGSTVIAVGHQNLYQHSLFTTGYVIPQNEALYSLFETYGVRLFMSGHMHIQHIMTRGSVTEIATGALSVSPCRYGMLTIGSDFIDYHTRYADVSAYARQLRSEDPNMLNFTKYAAETLTISSVRNSLPTLTKAGLSKDRILELLNYICAVNRMYFSGDMKDLKDLDPDGKLTEKWTAVSPNTGAYLKSLLPEDGMNHNTVRISK